MEHILGRDYDRVYELIGTDDDYYRANEYPAKAYLYKVNITEAFMLVVVPYLRKITTLDPLATLQECFSLIDNCATVTHFANMDKFREFLKKECKGCIWSREGDNARALLPMDPYFNPSPPVDIISRTTTGEECLRIPDVYNYVTDTQIGMEKLDLGKYIAGNITPAKKVRIPGLDFLINFYPPCDFVKLARLCAKWAGLTVSHSDTRKQRDSHDYDFDSVCSCGSESSC